MTFRHGVDPVTRLCNGAERCLRYRTVRWRMGEYAAAALLA